MNIEKKKQQPFKKRDSQNYSNTERLNFSLETDLDKK